MITNGKINNINKKEIVNNMFAYSNILLKKDNILELDKDKIIHDFFLEIFNINTSITPFPELRNFFVDFFSYTKIDYPHEKEEFYTYLFKDIIRLSNTPQYEFSKVKSVIQDTLTLIDNVRIYNQDFEEKLNTERGNYYTRIESINRDITNYKKKFKDYNFLIKEKKLITHELLPAIKSKIEECRYYHKLVEQEISKIRNLDIAALALIKAKEANSKYKYQFSYIQENEDYYKTGYDYSITIKFTKELFSFINTYEKTYATNKQEAETLLKNYRYSSYKLEKIKSENINNYKEILFNYIKESEVIKYIETGTKDNHVLNKRYSVIKSAVNAFKNKDYLGFMNIAPIQIEGIFFDMCDEFEIIPDELSSYSLTTKVNEIGTRVPEYDEKPYFLFHFPLIRNKVAHGLFLQVENIEVLAFEMLLDLQYLVYVMNEKEYIPYVEPLNFVKKFKKKHNADSLEKIYNTKYENIRIFSWLNTKSYEKRIKWILNPSYDYIYEFYESEDLMSVIIEIRNLIHSKDFLSFVKEKYMQEKKQDAFYPNQSNKFLKRWEKIISLLLIYLKEHNEEQRKTIIKFKRELKKS
ncbi:hypothetical protein [Priestia sp. YIM B13489]|uniref:hypothetical protein n=1 Tax=Priestia sp. YIM B13489 TaxID=3366313 RepID=UPI0036720528